MVLEESHLCLRSQVVNRLEPALRSQLLLHLLLITATWLLDQQSALRAMLLAQARIDCLCVIAAIRLLHLMEVIRLLLLAGAVVLIVVPGLLVHQVRIDSVVMVVTIEVLCAKLIAGTSASLGTAPRYLLLYNVAVVSARSLFLFLRATHIAMALVSTSYELSVPLLLHRSTRVEEVDVVVRVAAMVNLRLVDLTPGSR